MQLIDLTHPEGPRGTPRAQEDKIQKSKLGYFYRSYPTKKKFKGVFVLLNFLIRHSPEVLWARQKLKKGSVSRFTKKSWELGVLHKTKLEGDIKSLTFCVMQHLTGSSLEAQRARQKPEKWVSFQVCYMKAGNLGVLHKRIHKGGLK